MPNPEFRTLPDPIALDEAVEMLDGRPVQDPEGDRNKDQFLAIGNSND